MIGPHALAYTLAIAGLAVYVAVMTLVLIAAADATRKGE